LNIFRIDPVYWAGNREFLTTCNPPWGRRKARCQRHARSKGTWRGAAFDRWQTCSRIRAKNRGSYFDVL